MSSESGAVEDKWTTPNNKHLNELQSRIKLFVKVLTPIKSTPGFSLSSTTGGGRHFERQETFQVRSTIHGVPVKKRNVATSVSHSRQKAIFTERNSSRLGTHNGADMIQRQSEARDDNGRFGVLFRPFKASRRRFSNCTGLKCQAMGFGNNIRRLTIDARLRYMGIGKRFAKRHR